MTKALHLELNRIALASGTPELEPIIPNAGLLLEYLEKWRLWRMAGKPHELRAGGLFDQIEEEQDAIFAIEAEFQKIAKLNGKEGI